MDEKEELNPTQTADFKQARLICNDVEAIRDGVIVRLERAPMGDWAMLNLMGEING